MDYSGRVVVITGASSGIGKESAAKFARLGASVALVARDGVKLGEAAGELAGYGVPVLACACDVSRKEEVEGMGRKVLEKFGRVDVLVNNAGFGVYGRFSEVGADAAESQMATNYLGMVYCTGQFLPGMLERRSGHIVNVASVAASFGIPAMAGYCASKFAMLGFSESLYHELKGSGVGVTVVSPIMVRTNFFDGESFRRMPKYTYALSASAVAGAVVRAASSPRLEIITPQAVRIAVWFKQTLPYLVNPIVGQIFRRSG
ncbi:MAG: SDR family NAD(P)-dependent oxidoreductase [Thaumarchaeota archaeon]|nr:SDR family NAD(P)-dependent oxidoreductase [Nitrososphaerota archaeon]